MRGGEPGGLQGGVRSVCESRGTTNWRYTAGVLVPEPC